MPKLQTSTIHLHYEIEGSGPPLVLVPGMFSDSASWLPIMPLATRFTLVRPDPRGAGRTRPWDAKLTLDTLADDVLTLTEHLGFQRFGIVGHSLGGLVTARLAGRASARLTGAAILGSSPLPSARLPQLFRTFCRLRDSGDDRLWREALFPWLYNDGFFRDPATMEAAIDASIAYPYAQSAEAMRHQTSALGKLDLKSLPERFDCPTMALLGAEDAMIPADQAQKAWHARGAHVEIVKASGHALHWDQPQAVMDALTDFFATPGRV